MTAQALPRDGAAQPAESRPRQQRYSASEIAKLKERDNTTNVGYLAIVYGIMAVTIAATVWAFEAALAGDLAWGWAIAVSIVAVFSMGASQHQLGGAIHEGTHYMLFADKRTSEIASDWLCAFPIYTSTYAFRLHHLAHHQFVNDPQRDPNFDQAKESGHWLDFPIAHIEFLLATAKLLWLPNTIRYIVARAKYSAIGVDTNPYADTTRKGSKWAIRNGVLFAVGAPAVAIPLIATGHHLVALAAVVVMWAAISIYYYAIPDDHYPQSKIDPVISHRATAIGRMTWLGIMYAGLTILELVTGAPAWGYYGLLWILPLFTTFPLFMILREWLQHGNADRGRLTNSRILLSGPVARYAIFPWGMDYHLPHHLFASVPHYKLKELHEVMLRDPEYKEKCLIAEGWAKEAKPGAAYPSIIEILGPKFACESKEIHIDNETLAEASVNDKAGVARHVEQSMQQKM